MTRFVTLPLEKLVDGVDPTWGPPVDMLVNPAAIGRLQPWPLSSPEKPTHTLIVWMDGSRNRLAFTPDEVAAALADPEPVEAGEASAVQIVLPDPPPGTAADAETPTAAAGPKAPKPPGRKPAAASGKGK